MPGTSKSRSIPTVLAGAASAAVLAVCAVGTPAQAAASVVPALPAGAVAIPAAPNGAADCPRGKLCFWSGPNFTGDGWYFNKPSNGLQCHSAQIKGVPAPRSAVNLTNGNMAVYRVGACFGVFQLGVIQPGYQVFDVSNSLRMYAYNWTL